MVDGLDASDEVALLAPVRWADRPGLAGYQRAARHLDHALRNTRVLARQGLVALRRDEPLSPGVPAGVRGAASAARLLQRDLAAGVLPADARAAAVAAAHGLAVAVDEGTGPFATVVAAQARSIAVDLLLATGLSREEVLEVVDSGAAPGRAR
jgi:hypothetical protein